MKVVFLKLRPRAIVKTRQLDANVNILILNQISPEDAKVIMRMNAERNATRIPMIVVNYGGAARHPLKEYRVNAHTFISF